MDNFNVVDYVIIAIFFLSIVVGFSRGGVKEVMSVLTWLAAFLVAGMFASPVAAYFTGNPQVQSAISSASNNIGVNPSQQISWLAFGGSFIGLFILTMIVGSIISSLVSSVVSGLGIGFFNRLLGGLFGVGRGFLINLLLIFLIQLVPQAQQEPLWTQSVIVTSYQPAVQWLSELVAPGIQTIKSKVGQTLENVNSTVHEMTK